MAWFVLSWSVTVLPRHFSLWLLFNIVVCKPEVAFRPDTGRYHSNATRCLPERHTEHRAPTFAQFQTLRLGIKATEAQFCHISNSSQQSVRQLWARVASRSETVLRNRTQ